MPVNLQPFDEFGTQMYISIFWYSEDFHVIIYIVMSDASLIIGNNIKKIKVINHSSSYTCQNFAICVQISEQACYTLNSGACLCFLK